MGRNKGAWSKDRGGTPTKRMGLRLLAFFASVSLMVVGFGALGGSPASAEPGGQGGGDIYAPNQCADGFDFKDGKCVRHPDLADPKVTYVGNCENLMASDAAAEAAAAEETATEEPATEDTATEDTATDDTATEDGVDAANRRHHPPVYAWVFQTDTGTCKGTLIRGYGPPTLEVPGTITDTIRTCPDGYKLFEIGKADIEDATWPKDKKYMCVKFYEPQDPTCISGDTLVQPGAQESSGLPRGPLCYTPKAYCEKITGGVWGPSGDPRGSGKDNGREGKCWLPITFDICQFVLADHPRDHVAEVPSNKPGDKPKPIPTGTYKLVTVTANYHFGRYEAQWPPDPFKKAITPLVLDPSHHDGLPPISSEQGNQPFLARGCKDAVPVTPVVPGGPTPVKDYCSNIAGVQWENYDCATGSAPTAVGGTEAVAPVVAPAPATVVTPAKKPTKKPAKVTVVAPAAATVPSAVPAGGGATAPSDVLPTWALLMIVIGGLGVAASGMRLAGSHLRR